MRIKPPLLLHELSATVVIRARSSQTIDIKREEYEGLRVEVESAPGEGPSAAAAYGPYCFETAVDLLDIASQKAGLPNEIGRALQRLSPQDTSIDLRVSDQLVDNSTKTIEYFLNAIPSSLEKEVTFHFTQQHVTFSCGGNEIRELRQYWGIAADFWPLKSRGRPRRVFRESAGTGVPNFSSNLSLDTGEIEATVEMCSQALTVPKKLDRFLFSPKAAGILFHEILGHALEEPSISALTKYMKAGFRWFPDFLTVVDSPKDRSLFGARDIDDRGQPSKETKMIDSGYVSAYFGSRDNRKKLGINSTDNLWRQDFRYPCLARMSNLVIHSGSATMQEMIDSLAFGCLIASASEGRLDYNSGCFEILVWEAYLVTQGRRIAALEPFILEGKVPTIWNEILALSDSAEASSMYCDTRNSVCPVGHRSPGCLVAGLTVRPQKTGYRHVFS